MSFAGAVRRRDVPSRVVVGLELDIDMFHHVCGLLLIETCDHALGYPSEILVKQATVNDTEFIASLT